MLSFLPLQARRTSAAAYALLLRRTGGQLPRALLIQVSELWALSRAPFGLEVMEAEALRRERCREASQHELACARMFLAALRNQVRSYHLHYYDMQNCKVRESDYYFQLLECSAREQEYYHRLKWASAEQGNRSALYLAAMRTGVHFADLIAATADGSLLAAQTLYANMRADLNRRSGRRSAARKTVLSRFGGMLARAAVRAAAGGHLPTARWLSRCGAKDYRQMLCAAAAAGRLPVVEWAFRQAPDADAVLSSAATGGHWALIEWAVARGARDWNAALVSAAANGHSAVAELAVARGADNFAAAIELTRLVGSPAMVEWLQRAANE